MIKVAVIGIGKMGISHLSILGGMDDVNVVGVADTSSWITEPLRKYSPYEVYQNHQHLLEEKNPDAVIISVPTRFHAGIVEEVIQLGKHVFVEKPLTMSPQQSQTLVQLAKKYQVVNQVGYHNKFIGTFKKAKQLIDQGILGKLVHFNAESYGPVVTKKQQQTWRFKNKEGGGCLLDYASHVIDLLQYLISPIQEVKGALLKSIYSQQVEDAVYAILVTKCQVNGLLQINWSEPTYRKMATTITIQGVNGKLIVDPTEIKLFIHQAFNDLGYKKGWNIINNTNLTEQPSFYLRGEEYSLQLSYFLKCVSSRTINEINHFEQAAMTDEVMQTIRNHNNRHGSNHFWR